MGPERPTFIRVGGVQKPVKDPSRNSCEYVLFAKSIGSDYVDDARRNLAEY